jgi:hypothetical protein
MFFRQDPETAWPFPRFRGCDHMLTARVFMPRGGETSFGLVAPGVSDSLGKEVKGNE